MSSDAKSHKENYSIYFWTFGDLWEEKVINQQRNTISKMIYSQSSYYNEWQKHEIPEAQNPTLVLIWDNLKA